MTDAIFSLPLHELRQRTSLKWATYDDDVLPMWVAEMDARPIQPVVEAITDSLQRGETGYPARTVYEDAWANFTEQRWNWRPHPQAMRLVPDVMQGIAVVLSSLTTPGDSIVVNSPVYPPFFPAVRDRGCTVLDVPMNDDGRLDLPAIAAVYADQRPRAHLLCSPHNPTGVVHSRDELTELAHLARRYDVHLVVDEIHSPLVQAGVEFVPWLSIAEAQRHFVVVSAAKGWNLASLKAGLVIGGTDAVDAIAALPYAPTRGGASHTAVLAHVAALTYAPDWPSQVMTEIAANQALLRQLLAEQLPSVTFTPGSGTYLAWLDGRNTGHLNPAAHWHEVGRVAFNPGSDFGGQQYQGFARMNLATSPELIREGVRRMVAAG